MEEGGVRSFTNSSRFFTKNYSILVSSNLEIFPIYGHFLLFKYHKRMTVNHDVVSSSLTGAANKCRNSGLSGVRHFYFSLGKCELRSFTNRFCFFDCVADDLDLVVDVNICSDVDVFVAKNLLNRINVYAMPPERGTVCVAQFVG